MGSPPVLLRPVGFWTQRHGDGLPDPKKLQTPSWERDRRGFIAGYLMTGAVLDEIDPTNCAICGVDAGHRERTDGVWRWPEGLAHYVTAHGVRLPDELVQHMAAHSFTAPRVDVKHLRESLPRTNPTATSLISKGSVAAELDEMLAEPVSKKSPTIPKKGKRDKAENTLDDALDDETASIPAASPWKLLVQGVPTNLTTIIFDRPIVIGRDRTCDVVLDHKSVSRRHVRIVPWKDRVIVQDLGSSNGVIVKSKRREGQM